MLKRKQKVQRPREDDDIVGGLGYEITHIQNLTCNRNESFLLKLQKTDGSSVTSRNLTCVDRLLYLAAWTGWKFPLGPGVTLTLAWQTCEGLRALRVVGEGKRWEFRQRQGCFFGSQTCSLKNMDIFHFVPSFKFRTRAASKLFSPSFLFLGFFSIFIVA